MGAPPYMKLYVADYLGDTHHLGALEHGAYLLLLMAMWRAGGSLPGADLNLSKLARCTPEQWAEIREAVLPYFRRTRGRLTHKRLAEEMAKYENTSGKRSEAGKRGAAEKARKNSDNAQANASGDESNSRHNQNQNQKEEDKEANASSVAAAATKRAQVQQAFDAWNDLARRLSLPLAKTLDEGRRKTIAKRLEDGGLEAWTEALAGVARSTHCRGENDRNWKADLDFVCQLKSWRRLREGFYGTDAPDTDSPIGQDWPESRWAVAVDLWRKDGSWDERLGPVPGAPGCRVPSPLLIQPTTAERVA